MHAVPFRFLANNTNNLGWIRSKYLILFLFPFDAPDKTQNRLETTRNSRGMMIMMAFYCKGLFSLSLSSFFCSRRRAKETRRGS